MASRVEQLCDAIVDTLEAGETAGAFSKSILTERQYVSAKELDNLSEVSVMVLPFASMQKRRTQTSFDRYWICDVRVRKAFTSSQFFNGMVDRQTLDQYFALLEEVDDFLATTANSVLTLSGGETAECIEPGDEDVEKKVLRLLGIDWNEKALEEGLFSGNVKVAYRIEAAY